MKKFLIACSALLLTTCSSISFISDKSEEYESETAPDWKLYSRALHYKSIKEYPKAIRTLLNAVSSGRELHRVYYQLSECYYYLYDYNTSINFAKMSIERDRTFIPPYLLIHKIYRNLKNHTKSAAILEKLLKERPDLVSVHFKLGAYYYSQVKNFDKACTYFNTILQISQQQSVANYYKEYANYYLGYISYHKNDYNRSIEYFKQTVEINPDNYPTHYILASLLMHLYRTDEAKLYIERYLTKYPNDHKMHSFIGRILYLENNSIAVNHLSKAMRSKTIDGIIARSLYLELLKRDKNAERYLTTIVKKQPRFISPHIALARVSLRKGDKQNAFSEFLTASLLLYKVKLYNQARENLIRTLSIKDKVPEVYFYLGKIYEETDNLALAIVQYKKTYELKPRNELLIHLGYLYSLRKNYGKAITYLNQAINKEPENPKTYFIKGIVYSKNENYPQAEKYIKKAITIEENDTFYFYLATVQEKHKKLPDAINSLKKAIQFNSQNARAYNYLGYLYADNNMNIGESIALIKKALTIDPLNGAYLDSLGWAYYRQGKYKLALKKLLEAEKQFNKDNSPDPIVYDHIAETYKEIGNQHKAIEYWKKSLQIKKDPEIQKKLMKHKKILRGNKE